MAKRTPEGFNAETLPTADNRRPPPPWRFLAMVAGAAAIVVALVVLSGALLGS